MFVGNITHTLKSLSAPAKNSQRNGLMSKIMLLGNHPLRRILVLLSKFVALKPLINKSLEFLLRV